MQHSNKHTPMEVNNKYIRFDWAVKRMLRDKANFAVLEGLITVLTGEVVKIEELLRARAIRRVPATSITGTISRPRMRREK